MGLKGGRGCPGTQGDKHRAGVQDAPGSQKRGFSLLNIQGELNIASSSGFHNTKRVGRDLKGSRGGQQGRILRGGAEAVGLSGLGKRGLRGALAAPWGGKWGAGVGF